METAIYKGLLGKTPYEVIPLDNTHLDEILTLQQKVYESLPDKKVLQPLTKEEFLYILNGQGKMVGAYIEKEMIAFRALLIPEIDDDEHLGYDVGLTKKSELKRVLYQEISNVHPDYRGYGLQKTLAKVIMDTFDQSAFDYVCATVAPFNIASLKDKLAQGMYIVSLKNKYGGKLRYTFAMPLHDTVEFTGEPIDVSMADIEGQQQLLMRGYIGISISNKENDWFVTFKYIRQ